MTIKPYDKADRVTIMSLLSWITINKVFHVKNWSYHSVKHEISQERKTNRKTPQTIFYRPLTFKWQEEVLKLNDIFRSWSSQTTTSLF